MSRVLAVSIPASDVAFGERVRHVIAGYPEDPAMPEGIARLETVLRQTYPRVTIVPQGGVQAGGVPRTTVLDVHRDGLAPTMAPNMRWLEAVYDRGGGLAYRAAAQILGPGPRAERVVEQAFADLGRSFDEGVSVASAAITVELAARRLADESREDMAASGAGPVESRTADAASDASFRIGGVRRTLSQAALMRLGAGQRAAVEMAVLEDLKVRAIAARMHTSPSVVDRYLREALLAVGSGEQPSAASTLTRWRDAERRWAQLPPSHADRPDLARAVAYAWLDHQVATRATPAGTVILITDADRQFVASSAASGGMLHRPSVIGLHIDDITADYARPMVADLWTVFDNEGSMSGEYDCDRPGKAALRVSFRGVWGRPLPELQVGYLHQRSP